MRIALLISLFSVSLAAHAGMAYDDYTAWEAVEGTLSAAGKDMWGMLRGIGMECYYMIRG